MKKLNSVELKDKQAVLMKRCKEIVDVCKTEIREMTDEEAKEFNDNKEEIKNLKEQLDELNKKLAQYDEELPEDKEDDGDESAEDKENKIINNRNFNTMKKNISIVKEIRSAMDNGTKQFTINADTKVEKRNGEITVATEGEDVVEKQIQGILEPLYANSVLSKLGVKWYTGVPMGDISIPVMGNGNVGWAGEIAAAGASTNTFTSVLLQPKRLTAYVDISKKLIAQDTIGVENAIRRDIVNALNDKLEATIFGSASGSTTQPAGIFYGATLKEGDTFAKIVANEAEVEDANVYGDMKYLLSTGAKADLRAMAKSSKNTQLVYEGGEVDGVPALTTSNVTTAGAYVYGDFSNLAVASWGDIDITVDEYSQAVNGCVRLVVNAYFDAKVLRPEAFVFGKTRA
jgi:HK97 family phage major capsid protein